MDFGLSPEQEQLYETVSRFLAEQCPPSRVRSIMETDQAHDSDLWSRLAELGINSIVIPEDHGGIGGEFLELALVSEALGYAATPGPFLGNAMATIALVECENEEARTQWLEKLASGKCSGTVALGEGSGVWSPEDLSAQVNDGLLSGEKPLVPHGRIADFFVVSALEGSDAGLWLIDAHSSGIEIEKLGVNDMTRPLDAVNFNKVPAVRLGGSDLVQRVLDAGAILIAADALGGARRAIDMARTYVLQREQFGQVIGSFQAVKHQLADQVTDLEPAVSLVWYTAHAFDKIKDKSSRHAALAKAHLCDLFDSAARVSTELHGGIGFTWEFDLHIWFRRAIFDRSFLGDSASHRRRAASLAQW